MSRTQRPLLSSIGMKSLMAVTGLALLLFVIVHMVGNLQIYLGPERLNAYAKGIQNLGALLWVARVGLFALLAVHVACAVRLNVLNQAARPAKYLTAEPQVTTYAARTMFMSGLIVVAFVAYHILHLTLGVTNPEHYGLHTPDGRHDVYSMVVKGFQQWPIAVAYVVAQALLCLHISHGASSAFQSLGVTHPRLAWLKGGLGRVVAAVIFVGNVSIPLSCLAGLVQLPAGVR